jgi:hypothetical protein
MICQTFIITVDTSSFDGLWICFFLNIHNIPDIKTKLRGFSPQANYTDRETTACQQSYCQLLQIGGVMWSAQLIPMAINLSFLDLEYPRHIHN